MRMNALSSINALLARVRRVLQCHGPLGIHIAPPSLMHLPDSEPHQYAFACPFGGRRAGAAL